MQPLKTSNVRLRTPILIIMAVILADQALKIWIKTHYHLWQEHEMLGMSWARLHFVENEGMAWGLSFGGNLGKMALTLFRLFAVIFGTWYIRRIVKMRYTRGFVVCAALIYAGALGNLIDSMFYGLIFNESTNATVAQFVPFGTGYTNFLHGRVVDMLYFPIFHIGNFQFFNAIFNIADASISVGVITLLIFQKRFMHHESAVAHDAEVAGARHAENADHAENTEKI